MASPSKPLEKKEQSPDRGSGSVKKSQSQERLPMARGEIAGALSEGVEGASEKVSEVSSDAGEKSGSGMPASGKGDDQGAATTFTFDESNLPPAPQMIRKIEQHLRREIRSLEKQARYYQGGVLRKPDFPKYSEAIIEIRKKHVLLRRLFSFATETLKKLFLQIFGPRKA